MSATARCARPLTVASLAALLVLLASAPAAVASDGPGGPQSGSDEDDERPSHEIEIEIEDGVLIDGEGADGGDGGASLPDGMTYVVVPRLGSTGDPDDNDGVCRAEEWLLVDEEEAAATRNDARNDYYFIFDQLVRLDFPTADADHPCPTDDEGQQTVDPAQVRVAVETVVREELPLPEPYIAPGHALAGMPAYLETGRELTFGPSEQRVREGPLDTIVTIRATGTTEVDWGDGTVRDYEAPDGPYPDGEVVHTYADAGVVDVHVTDVWEVEYDVAGLFSDALTLEVDAQTLPDLEVRELQSVRTPGG